jgi:hypothetical protein
MDEMFGSQFPTIESWQGAIRFNGKVDQRRRHSGAARKSRTRDLEIPGSMLRIAPE